MPLTIFKRGEVWHFRGTVAGRRLRGSCGTADKATAQRIAAETEARQWKCRLDGPEAVLTFAEAAMIYRRAKGDLRFVDVVEDYWKDTPVRDITSGAVQRSALVLYPRCCGATRNRQAIVPTQAVINYAAEMELCRPLKVKRFPVVKHEKEPATWEWVQAFMAASSPHLAALACFMFLTGARVGEAIELCWGDVDLTARRALIKQTKIGAERRAHLPTPLVVALANIPSDRSPEDKVFRYSSQKTAQPVWRNACRRAGIKSLSFHACRHGFATALLHRKIDPVTVAKVGGWKSPQHVFATYGHAMDDDTVSDAIIDTPVTRPTNRRKKSS